MVGAYLLLAIRCEPEQPALVAANRTNATADNSDKFLIFERADARQDWLETVYFIGAIRLL